MKQYVVGLLFRKNRTEVALIHKKRPAWQAGLMNGVGGKIGDTIPGETPIAAMEREWREETDSVAPYWVHFLETPWRDGVVHYFLSESDGVKISSPTDEEVDWVRVDDISHIAVVPNLRWVVPLALAFFREAFYAHVDYTRDPLAEIISRHLTTEK